MWIYRHVASGNLLATNPKVMTRTLEDHDSLQRVISRSRYVHFAAKTLHPRLGSHATLLVRNPYKRVESFFREKLRAKVQQAASGDYTLKRHQQVFYPALGITEHDPLERRIEALLGLEFDDYVALIPTVCAEEDHLTPQSVNLSRRVAGRLWHLPFNRIVQIEDPDAMADVARRFDLDLTIRRNSTSKSPLEWSDSSRRVVQEVYSDDFERFGYPS